MKKNKEFFYTDFNSLGSVMNEIVQNSNLKNGVKKATLFKFWNKVAGKKFEQYSKIESLNTDGVLTVACANAAVSSELLMFKQDIIKKINIYAKPLGLEISDINFSHKLWKNEKRAEIFSQEASKNPYKHDLSGFNPDEIELDEKETASIKASIDANKFASEKQRTKMYNAIIKDLKIQKYCSKNTSNP